MTYVAVQIAVVTESCSHKWWRASGILHVATVARVMMGA